MKEISAGGIVFRYYRGQPELLLIEDRFRKITFAKGRTESGENLAATALREIEEETGIRGRISRTLGDVTYTYYDHTRGRIHKVVTYYLVEALGGDLKPQLEEISRVQWYPLAEAETLHNQNGYANNKDIFSQTLAILRHGKENGR